MICPPVLVLFIALSLCILAHIAIYWIRKTRQMRNVCRKLIADDMSRRGKTPSQSDVEEVLRELEEKED